MQIDNALAAAIAALVQAGISEGEDREMRAVASLNAIGVLVAVAEPDVIAVLSEIETPQVTYEDGVVSIKDAEPDA